MNGKAAKSASNVRLGDEIEIKRRHRHTKVCVTAIPEKKQMSKDEAGNLIKIISEKEISADPLST